MNFEVIRLFLCFGILLNLVDFSKEISCKDEKDQDVDWFVNYKLPRIKENAAMKNIEDGSAYTYITSSKPGNWKLSSKSIKSTSSMLGNTLESFYVNKKNAAYLFYNDQPRSDFEETTVGHLKGVVAFDRNSGYWLVHSMPKFGDDYKYEYPDNALLYGQSILCVTFKTSELNKICNQLLYSHPNIYASGITDEIEAGLDDKAKSIFTDDPEFIKKKDQSSTVSLRSQDDTIFVSFAKDNQYNIDIYSDLIAPHLKASLMAETWRRGAGGVLGPSCSPDYQVLNVESISMTLPFKGKPVTVDFEYTDDHSKWAITTDSSQRWVCIGDLNRMESQEKRGGGSVCFYSRAVWGAYKNITAKTDSCRNVQ